MLSSRLILSVVFTGSCVLVDAASPYVVDDYDVLQYINPLIGSSDGGKCISLL